ncbi:hypothetical protein O181_054173 [Austropuccinia psidii MF-1]|uniref:Integrase catalytic domain-containing protein n=1 Tax=Austropuccinia psidii MF-1 TaxID=1389203 RepID=A0A9Q3E5S8_9BASI|nr:hypothetical protein [Austropuccinia psidii MF-1]
MCQKENRPRTKKYSKMVQTQEHKFQWEIVFLDWETALPPVGDRIFKECLVLADRYRKTLMFLICHKDETAMDTAMMILNRSISHTGLLQNIISDRDPKLYSDLSTNLHKLFCTNIPSSTACHPPNGWTSRENDTKSKRHDQKILCL